VGLFYSADRISGCFSAIKIQHSTQFALTFNRPGICKLSGRQQLDVDSLVVSKLIIKASVFLYVDFQMSPSQEYQFIQTFELY